MTWEVYGREAGLVNIQSNGRFRLDDRAVALLGNPTHVQLSYDRDTETAGIRAATADSLGAVEVRRGRFIQALGFWTWAELPSRLLPGTFPASFDAGLLTFQPKGVPHDQAASVPPRR